MVADEPETRHRAEHEDRTKDMERGLGAAAERHRLHELEPFDEDERPADEPQPAESHAAETPPGASDREKEERRADHHPKIRVPHYTTFPRHFLSAPPLRGGSE